MPADFFRLSQLRIDAIKDWGGFRVDNVGAPNTSDDIPRARAGDILAERFALARMPDAAINLVLTAQGVGIDPAYAAAGGGGDQSWMRYRQTGTRYYTGFTSVSVDTVVPAIDNLHAEPFYAPAAITLDRIAVHITAGVAGNMRLGIYSNGANIYPGALLLDAGVVSTAGAGVQTIIINQALAANTLYWLAFVSSSGPTMRSYPVYSEWPIFGFAAADFGDNGAWARVAQVYGALPTPFPGGATIFGSTTTCPTVAVRIA